MTLTRRDSLGTARPRHGSTIRSLLRRGGSSHAAAVKHSCVLSPFGLGVENRICLFSTCNRRAQSQYVTSETRILFLEQQRLNHSWI